MGIGPLEVPPPPHTGPVARSAPTALPTRSPLFSCRDMEAWTNDPMEWLRAHGGSARGVRAATESTLHGGGLVATEDLEAGAAITPIALAASVASTAASATHPAIAISTTLAATALARCDRPHRAAGAHAHGWRGRSRR